MYVLYSYRIGPRGSGGLLWPGAFFFFFLLVLPINFLAKIFCANLLGLAPGGKHDDDDDTGIPQTELYKKDFRKKGDVLRS